MQVAPALVQALRERSPYPPSGYVLSPEPRCTSNRLKATYVTAVTSCAVENQSGALPGIDRLTELSRP